MWAIRIQDGGKNSKIIELPMEKPILVGRSKVCDVRFDNPQISRRLFTLLAGPDGVDLRMESNAHSRPLVNGQILVGPGIFLQEGASIDLFGNKIDIIFDQGSDSVNQADEAHSAATLGVAPGGGDALASHDMLSSEDRTLGRETAGELSAEGGKVNDSSPEATLPAAEETELHPDETDAFEHDHESAAVPAPETGFDYEETAFSEETPATGGLPDADSRFDDADFSATSFLSEDDAKAILAQHAATRRKKLITTCLIAFGVLLAFVLLKPQDEPKEPVLHEGTYFYAKIPADWRVMVRDGLVSFSPTRQHTRGVAVVRYSDLRVWSLDYVSAADIALDMLARLTEKISVSEWDLTGVEHLPLLHLPDGTSIPYFARKGELPSGGHLLLRVYLAGDQIVGLVAWNESGAIGGGLHRVLDSFQIRIDQVRPDFTARDIAWRQFDDQESHWSDKLRDARALFEQRRVEPVNGWRAYSLALDALRQAVNRGQLNPESDDLLREIWEPHLIIYARFVEDFFQVRRTGILAARESRNTQKIRFLVDEIHNTIRDRKDPRWIWAQRMLTETGESIRGSGGFF